LYALLLAAVIEYKRLGNFFSEKIFAPLNEKFQQLIRSPLLLAAIIVLLLVLLIVVIYFLKRSKSKGAESPITKIIKGFIDGLKSVATLKKAMAVYFSICPLFGYYITWGCMLLFLHFHLPVDLVPAQHCSCLLQEA
jgi:hypothetical protein